MDIILSLYTNYEFPINLIAAGAVGLYFGIKYLRNIKK